MSSSVSLGDLANVPCLIVHCNHPVPNLIVETSWFSIHWHWFSWQFIVHLSVRAWGVNLCMCYDLSLRIIHNHVSGMDFMDICCGDTEMVSP